MLFEQLIAASFNKTLRRRVRAIYRMWYVDHDRSHEKAPCVDFECAGHFITADLSNDDIKLTSDTAPEQLLTMVHNQLSEIQ